HRIEQGPPLRVAYEFPGLGIRDELIQARNGEPDRFQGAAEVVTIEGTIEVTRRPLNSLAHLTCLNEEWLIRSSTFQCPGKDRNLIVAIVANHGQSPARQVAEAGGQVAI